MTNLRLSLGSPGLLAMATLLVTFAPAQISPPAQTSPTASSGRPDRSAQLSFVHHGLPVLDAHNCYPYRGQWNDRITRALSSGFPVSIEQDLAWSVDPSTGAGRVVVSHTPAATGEEPALRAYFFDQVRPVVEKALAQNHPETWPLIVLHFDFKSNRPELLRAVWELLGEYEPWLSTARKTADPAVLQPIERRPLLVVTEEADEQQKVFYDDLPLGAKLRLFGSAHTAATPKLPPKELMHWAVTASPEQLLTEHPTNYRRWWNSSWYTVEEGGQTRATEWTGADDLRLRALVNHAHDLGFWVRFYTLDGFAQTQNQGWSPAYNFGSLDAVKPRWKAAVAAGVNFIATDQYEDLPAHLRQDSQDLRRISPVSTTSAVAPQR